MEDCQLLLKISNKISACLKKSEILNTLTKQSAQDVKLILAAVSTLPNTIIEIRHGAERLKDIAQGQKSDKRVNPFADS